MEIILARHGNTFAPHEPSVWTGSSNDLPLVEKGIEQAEKLAAVLKAQDLSLSAVYCGPLQRTSHYATIIVQRLQLPFQPIRDPRINEIDYGNWTGLTHDQVIEKYGIAALTHWDEHSQWPKEGGWGGSEDRVIEEIHSFVGDLTRQFLPDSRVLVVTSNGRLRYFLKLIDGEFEKRVREKSIKVKTGHVCKLICGGTGSALKTKAIAYWNQEPSLQFRL